MAVRENMIRWKQEHTLLFCAKMVTAPDPFYIWDNINEGELISPMAIINWIGMKTSALELFNVVNDIPGIELFDFYPSYLHYFDEVYGLSDKSRMKKKTPCHSSNIFKRRNIINEDKITEYEIIDYVFKEITDRVDYRLEKNTLHGFRSKPNLYWAANKCRCLTCDLVRLAHRLDRHGIASIDPKLNKKYARISYYSGDNQWKTMTVSQVKQIRDNQRRIKRNFIQTRHNE